MAEINKEILITIIESLNFKRDKPNNDSNYTKKEIDNTLEISINIKLDLIVYISIPVGSKILRNQQKIDFSYLSQLEPFLITSVLKNEIDLLSKSIDQGIKLMS
ncbi:MAG: hypothetical protein H7263_02980, partial [Candidatus Sericytochromatia bacterium]|nr:hypothetical protein [Candidatus Sericytochromatia bacterium]